MGRVRGKGKKRTVIARTDNNGSSGEQGEESKESQQDIEKEAKDLNGTKRKRYQPAKENSDLVKEESGVETKLVAGDLDDSTKFVSFRHVGSRRKNTPRRAAEVGVECN